MQKPSPKQPSRLGAILSMELVLVLPIFLLLLFAVVEFSLIATAQSRINTVAQSATRQLSLHGATPDELKQQVQTSLGPKLAQQAFIKIIDPPNAGDIANVEVVVPMRNTAPNLLWIIGFDLNERHLSASAPMVKEVASATEPLFTAQVAPRELP